MDTIENRLKNFEQKIVNFSKDISSLRSLLTQDNQSALNKMRYITEKILNKLCSANSVSWGKSEPTLENMVGPLIKKAIIPKDIATHVRAIQSYASPGSHFQSIPLSIAHVQICQMALIELLEWYFEIEKQEAYIINDAMFNQETGQELHRQDDPKQKCLSDWIRMKYEYNYDQKSFDTPESIARLEESTEKFLTTYELIGSETPAHLAERLANSDLSWNKKCVILDIISSLRIICLDETIISIAKEKWMNLNIRSNQDLLEHSFNTLGRICGIEMIPKFFDLAKDAIVSCYGHERKEKFHMTFAAIRGIH